MTPAVITSQDPTITTATPHTHADTGYMCIVYTGVISDLSGRFPL